VVGVGLFENARVGYVLWAAHVLAAIVLGILLTPRGRNRKFESVSFSQNWREFRNTCKPPIGKALGDAVRNAMEALVFVGGLIIFFSVLVEVADTILGLGENLYSGVFAGLAEVTGGVRRLSQLESNALTIGAAAFVIAFGGFSIHAQTFHFTSGTGIKALPYLMAKILHGVIAAVLTVAFSWILLYYRGKRVNRSEYVPYYCKSGCRKRTYSATYVAFDGIA